MAVDIYKRMFFYSPTAAANMKKIEGKGFSLPWVISNGVRKNYTEMVSNPSQVRYSDSIKIAEGDIRSIKYSH